MNYLGHSQVQIDPLVEQCRFGVLEWGLQQANLLAGKWWHQNAKWTYLLDGIEALLGFFLWKQIDMKVQALPLFVDAISGPVTKVCWERFSWAVPAKKSPSRDGSDEGPLTIKLVNSQ